MHKKVNYHIHTTFSDGKLSIEKVIGELELANVESFAITDHDKIQGAEYLINNPTKIQNVSGVELTAYFDNNLYPFSNDFSIHILAYDFDTIIMKNHLQQWSERRKLALKNLVYEIAEKGMVFDNISSRTALAKELLNMGVVNSFLDGIRYINKQANYKTCVPTISEVIRAISDAKGVSVWAHPLEILEYSTKTHLSIDYVKKILVTLIKAGINGIESEYSAYSTKSKSDLTQLASEYNLICSAGTDFHGKENDKLFISEPAKNCFLSNYLGHRERQAKVFLPGGRSTEGVYKADNFVFRPVKENDARTLPFLTFLQTKEFLHFSKYVETIDGQNKFLYVDGFVPDDIGRTTYSQLASFMKIIRKLHDVSTEFTNDYDKVICHNDLSPCNTVFCDNEPIAIIDWDSAALGERWEDLAYVLWLWINIGSHYRNHFDVMTQIKKALDVYGADAETKKNFADKLLWRMDKVIAEMQPDNHQYKRTKEWVDFSKLWVIDNIQQIKNEIG